MSLHSSQSLEVFNSGHYPKRISQFHGHLVQMPKVETKSNFKDGFRLSSSSSKSALHFPTASLYTVLMLSA